MIRVLLICILVAGAGANAGAGGTGQEAAENPAGVSFARDIVPLLRRSCATCHVTGTEPGNLALHPRAAYQNLVDAPSVQSKLLRVKPGAPEASYLLKKLEGTHLDAGGTGMQMPFGVAPLDANVIRKIREWIAAGAQNN